MKYVTYVLMNHDGIPFYVGAGREDRPQQHFSGKRGGRPEVQKIVDEHREKGLSLSYRIIGTYENKSDAFDAEKSLISLFGRISDGGILVNICTGGAGCPGYTPNDEMRAHNSKVQKIRFNNESERLAISEATRKGMDNDVVRSKISDGLLAKWNDETYRNRQIAAHTGKKDTDATRKKKSDALSRSWENGDRKSKYSDEVIYDVYTSKGHVPVSEIAAKYGMNPTYVHKIWRHERCVLNLKRLGIIL
jgi:hypothetical protein|uniref:GIY-YIG domain-containing protein n=1 Tax=Klebsiella phage phiYH65 TaxID=3237693 RepID=A0AB39ACI1_9CAUD